MSRKAKFALDEQRTSDGDGQAEAGGGEDRVLSPTTQERPRGGLTGSESRRGATPRQSFAFYHKAARALNKTYFVSKLFFRACRHQRHILSVPRVF